MGERLSVQFAAVWKKIRRKKGKSPSVNSQEYLVSKKVFTYKKHKQDSLANSELFEHQTTHSETTHTGTLNVEKSFRLDRSHKSNECGEVFSQKINLFSTKIPSREQPYECKADRPLAKANILQLNRK